jgi:V/A-type H+-transporting ATPase subunit I
MCRLRALVLRQDARMVLASWGELGAVQLEQTAPGPDTAPLPARDCNVELARCHDVLQRVTELRRMLKIPPASLTPPATQLTWADADATLRLWEARADEVMSRRQQCTDQVRELDASCELLARYCGFDLPLDGPQAFAHLHFATGSLPAENWQALSAQLDPHAAVLPLAVERGRQPLLVLTTPARWPALASALRDAGFQSDPLPVSANATCDSLAAERRREQQAAVRELNRAQTEARTLAVEYAAPLGQLEQLAMRERQLLAAEQQCSRTEATVLLAGWAPEPAVAKIERRTRELSHGCMQLETAPAGAADAAVPVLLQPPRWLRPFARLVAAYGLPDYHELEPTLFVALSYPLMFGLMFGDVGHGSVLAVAGGLMCRRARRQRLQDVGRLLVIAGLASVGFGCAYGSCFGLEYFKSFALWRDPLAGDPASLMQLAIAIGVVVISVGLVLNVTNRLRRGNYVGGCFGRFGLAGLLFYWGTLTLLLGGNFLEAHGLMLPALAAFVGMPLAGWALKEPLARLVDRRHGRRPEPGEGWCVAALISLVAAFEALLSYLANTISFVRLAAYAMSHAALLAAAFALADQARHLPLAGPALAALVVILGNAGALVLEGVIAAVQALRLEYYEFFGKFLTGEGRPFQPFRLVA